VVCGEVGRGGYIRFGRFRLKWKDILFRGLCNTLVVQYSESLKSPVFLFLTPFLDRNISFKSKNISI